MPNNVNLAYSPFPLPQNLTTGLQDALSQLQNRKTQNRQLYRKSLQDATQSASDLTLSEFSGKNLPALKEQDVNTLKTALTGGLEKSYLQASAILTQELQSAPADRKPELKSALEKLKAEYKTKQQGISDYTGKLDLLFQPEKKQAQIESELVKQGIDVKTARQYSEDVVAPYKLKYSEADKFETESLLQEQKTLFASKSKNTTQTTEGTGGSTTRGSTRSASSVKLSTSGAGAFDDVNAKKYITEALGEDTSFFPSLGSSPEEFTKQAHDIYKLGGGKISPQAAVNAVLSVSKGANDSSTQFDASTNDINVALKAAAEEQKILNQGKTTSGAGGKSYTQTTNSSYSYTPEAKKRLKEIEARLKQIRGKYNSTTLESAVSNTPDRLKSVSYKRSVPKAANGTPITPKEGNNTPPKQKVEIPKSVEKQSISELQKALESERGKPVPDRKTLGVLSKALKAKKAKKYKEDSARRAEHSESQATAKKDLAAKAKRVSTLEKLLHPKSRYDKRHAPKGKEKRELEAELLTLKKALKTK